MTEQANVPVIIPPDTQLNLPAKTRADLDVRNPVDMARIMVASRMFPDVTSASQGIVKIIAGQELGLSPIAAVRELDIIKGRVTLSAQAMGSLVKSSPKYDYKTLVITDKEVSILFFELVGGKWDRLGISKFTEEDAQTAGLLTGPNKHNWKNYRRNMLRSRAMSNGVKWYCPDITNGGAVYARDELDDLPPLPHLDDIEAPPTQPVATPATPTSQDAPLSEAPAAPPLPTIEAVFADVPKPPAVVETTARTIVVLGDGTEIYQDTGETVIPCEQPENDPFKAGLETLTDDIAGL